MHRVHGHPVGQWPSGIFNSTPDLLVNFSWRTAQHVPETLFFPPKGGAVGSLFKGQFCFPRWTLRREAMPSAQPHSALQPASPLHQPPVGPLLFWQMFVQCLWLEGGTLSPTDPFASSQSGSENCLPPQGRGLCWSH